MPDNVEGALRRIFAVFRDELHATAIAADGDYERADWAALYRRVTARISNADHAVLRDMLSPGRYTLLPKGLEELKLAGFTEGLPTVRPLN